MIIALEVPLAINLQKRAKAELETQALVQAQSLAAAIGKEGMTKTQARLDQVYKPQPGVRVVVVNDAGLVVADSAPSPAIGQQYVTPDRPEFEAVATAPHQPVTITRYSVDLGQQIMAIAVPIMDETNYYGAVRITESLAEVSANVRKTTLALIAIGFAGLLGGMFVAYLLAGSLSRPLTKLADTAMQLGDGDLTVRAGNTGGATEIKELAESFDEMASRLEAAMRAQQAFVANASHQLRTPLTGMKLRIEAALEDSTGDVRHQLEAADKEVDRLSGIVDDLLATSRERESSDAKAVAAADIGQAVARAMSRWEARAAKAGASLSASGGSGVAAAEPGDLDQILDNLIDNAIHYAPGPIAIETRRTPGRILLSVTDQGPGIRPEEVDLVTERFFRGRGTKPGGSGLGLAIARELAERWGGQIKVGAGTGSGTRVEVSLPAASGLVGT